MTVATGGRVLRSAPWLSLIASTAAAATLICGAALLHRTALAAPTTLLGLAACGAAASQTLDETATSVADASPTSRRRRAGWRLALVVLPITVAVCGLLNLSRLDPATHWLRLLPTALGVVAIGTGVAAVMRHTGIAAPGDLAGVVTLVGIVVILAVDPLRRWAPLVPLGETTQVGRSSLLWMAVVILSAAVTVTCTRDPGGRVRRLRLRR